METIKTGVRIYSFDIILNAINELIKKGYPLIDTKRIRHFLNIKNSNRAKINFIWRSLEYLTKEGYLEIFSDKSPKIYKLPKREIHLRC